MRLITIFELVTLKNSELQALFRATADELTRTLEGSADRRNALATLENITTVMRQRDHRHPWRYRSQVPSRMCPTAPQKLIEEGFRAIPKGAWNLSCRWQFVRLRRTTYGHPAHPAYPFPASRACGVR